MHSLVNGAQSLSESDWLKFLGAVRVWPSTLETIISYIGKTRSFDQIGKPFKELVYHLFDLRNENGTYLQRGLFNIK